MAKDLPARTTSDVLVRLEDAEQLIVEHVSPRKAARAVRDKYGISLRRANEDVRRVLKAWEVEGLKGDHRERKRARMRRALEDLVERATGRKGVYVNKKGETVEYDSPDIGGAVKAIELLCRLDGLLDQPESSPAAEQNIFVMLQQHYGLGEVVEAKRLNGKGSNGKSD